MFGLDIGAILASALTAFIPAGIDIVKGVANRWLGGAQTKPASFAEYLQLMTAETGRLEAIAKLDTPAGNVSKWVANLRGATRYIVVLIVLSVWAISAIVSLYVPVDTNALQQIGVMASAVMFFLFGDHINMAVQGFAQKRLAKVPAN